MQDMRWLDHLPDGTLESGVELANRLYQNSRLRAPALRHGGESRAA